MAKGKTNQALRLWVWHPWVAHPAIAELHDAGHKIAAIGSEGGLCDISGAEPQTQPPDAILHPAAHGWHEALFETFTRINGTVYRPYVDAFLKAARARKKGVK